MLENEFELVRLSKQGDKKAYEKLYRANIGRIYALCFRMCGQQELAEDLSQEVFIKAWLKLDSFHGDSAFSSWLYRLTTNLVISYLRQQKKWKNMNFIEQSHEKNLSTAKLNAEHYDLERMLSLLPDQLRVVFILYEYFGYKHREISDMTGLPVGSSKSHLHRARALLKDKL